MTNSHFFVINHACILQKFQYNKSMDTENQVSKRQSKQIDTYDRLLESAYHLFIQRGYDAVSIQDITEQAFIAKGTFYNYFRDKDDLKEQLITRKSSELFQMAIAALRQTGIVKFEDQIIFIVDYITDILSQNQDALKLIAKNLSFGLFNHKVNEIFTNDSMDILHSLVRAAEHSGIRLKNPKVLLFMIVELASSTCFSCILDCEPLEFAVYKPYLFDAIRQIIRSQTL